MEYRRARSDEARARRRSDTPPARIVSRQAASCITARANGIRANRCRAGRSHCIGGVTAFRSGATTSLIAREAADAQVRQSAMHSASPKGLPRACGIAADYVQPAYEDPADRMLKQGLIPENIDPERSEDRRSARARAHPRLVRQPSQQPAGFVLPVQRWTAQAQARMAERSVADAPRPAVPGARRFPARLPAAAAIAARISLPSTIRTSCRPTRSPPGHRCPIRASPIRSGRTRCAYQPAMKHRRRSRPRLW